jgi:Obg family GTPase CgtA
MVPVSFAPAMKEGMALEWVLHLAAVVVWAVSGLIFALETRSQPLITAQNKLGSAAVTMETGLKFLTAEKEGLSISSPRPMSMRVTVCRACINRLSSAVQKRSFSISGINPFPIKDAAPEPPSRTKFSGYSSAVVTIKSGNGGNGCIAFELSRTVPGRGTPSGGNGGRGGDVYIIAHGTGDLRGVPPTLAADNGAHGEGRSIHGRKGRDVVLQVPLGTVVYEMTRKSVIEQKDNFVHGPLWEEDAGEDWQIADLLKRRATGLRRKKAPKEFHEIEEEERAVYMDLKKWTGEPVLLLRGGKGGLGNINFQTQDIKMPRFGTKGESGTEMNILLELKLMADVALVGLPNAGKSTLLSRISRANAKVGHYAFTTVAPQLGTVILREGEHERSRFVVADLPGLSFRDEMAESVLKHVRRVKVVAYIIDLSSETCWEDYQFLKGHVDLRIGLNLRELIVCNKADLPGTEERMQELRNKMGDSTKRILIPVCAKDSHGLGKVIDILEKQVEEARKEEQKAEEEKLARQELDMIGWEPLHK